MKFTFRGSDRPVGPRWEEGFKDAYNSRLEGKDPFKEIPDWYSRDGEYRNGFAEGQLSGRSAYHRLLSIDNVPSNRFSCSDTFRLN